MQYLEKIISKSFLEYQKTKLYGEEIILTFHHLKDSLSGIKYNPMILV